MCFRDLQATLRPRLRVVEVRLGPVAGRETVVMVVRIRLPVRHRHEVQHRRPAPRTPEPRHPSAPHVVHQRRIHAAVVSRRPLHRPPVRRIVGQTQPVVVRLDAPVRFPGGSRICHPVVKVLVHHPGVRLAQLLPALAPDPVRRPRPQRHVPLIRRVHKSPRFKARLLARRPPARIHRRQRHRRDPPLRRLVNPCNVRPRAPYAPASARLPASTPRPPRPAATPARPPAAPVPQPACPAAAPPPMARTGTRHYRPAPAPNPRRMLMRSAPATNPTNRRKIPPTDSFGRISVAPRPLVINPPRCCDGSTSTTSSPLARRRNRRRHPRRRPATHRHVGLLHSP